MAERLAEEVRASLYTGPSIHYERFDFRLACAAGGFRPKVAELGTQVGRHEALLVPSHEGGFTVLIDPRTRRDGVAPSMTSRRRFRFRLAHEIGHSFFYDRSRKPP